MNTPRPRILLIGDTLNVGGTEGQFVEVACRLDRSRWDVQVSCLRAVGPLKARVEAAGLRAWSCGRGSFKSPRFLMAVCGLARYLRAHRINLVHSFDFYSNILGVPAARLARVPAVIASQRELDDLRSRLQRRVHRAALRLADYVLANSGAVADRLKRARAIPPGRIVVIPNGVDAIRFSPAPARTRRLPDQVTVGTLANLRPEKGIEDLVRAMVLVRDRYPEGRLVLWGGGPLAADLERLIGDLGLSGEARLCGPTTGPEAALRELDIFVLPSLSEACSNVLLEAMASGLPVVATRVGGTPALVEDETTGLLVPPRDPAALAKAIIRLLEDPALAERLGARAREVVRSNFSLDRMLSRIETLYEQALGGQKPCAPAHSI